MKNCLPEETIELLSARSLRGKELVEALRHLETCADCRSKVRMPIKEEILKRLEPDEEDLPSPPTSKTTPNPKSPASAADKEREEAFQKLLDRIRGNKKTEFRKVKEPTVFQLFPGFSFLESFRRLIFEN